MRIIPPISFRKRDKAVTKLIRAGQATDDELFEAQFNEWPVRGLNKDTNCSDIVHFKGFHSDKKLNPFSYIFSMGYTRKEDVNDKTIYLNGGLLSPLGHVLGALTTRLAIARAHDALELFIATRAPALTPELLIISFLSSYRYAIASSLTRMFAPSVADIVGEEQIHIKQFKEDNRNIARAAFQNVASDWLNNQKALPKLGTQFMQAIDSVLTMMPRSYFSSDYELQARMHNVIVRGYPVWGKIPENIDEFYMAMQDMGIKSPKIVRKHYADPAFDPLKLEFKKHASWVEAYTSPPNAEMNIGLNSYRSKDVLEMYWHDCLPYLYGDLLVKYGDSNGLERMGYTAETDLLGMPIRAETPALPQL